MLAKKQQNRRVKAQSRYRRWQRQSQYARKNLLADLRKQPLASLLTVLVITISLMLPTVCYVLWKNAIDAADKWYPTPNLTIYLDKQITAENSQQLITQLEALPEVKSTRYLSKEDSLNEFREWSGFNKALDLLNHNPLPAVIIVTPENQTLPSEQLAALRDKLYTYIGVDDIRLDDGWFTRLTALTSLVGYIAVVLTTLMIIAIFLVIGNSVRLNILARKKTIHVMRLIGATDGFILRPFLYHGALLGFTSALLSIALSSLFIWRVESIVTEVSATFGTQFILQGLTLDEIGLILLCSTIIGWVSAWLTTMRFLHLELFE